MLRQKKNVLFDIKTKQKINELINYKNKPIN